MIPSSAKELTGWNRLLEYEIKYAVPTNTLQLVGTAYLLIVSN